MRLTTFFAMMGLLLAAPLFAQKPAAPKTLPDLIDSIKVEMEKAHIPGMLLSIVSADSVLYDQGVGMAHIAQNRPLDNKQRFRLGSITKTFAALCILQLEKEGKFKITDKLSDLAPEIAFTNSWEATHPVRLIHLLEHTSGFDDMHFAAFYVRDKNEPSAQQLLERHSKSLYTRWKPGTRMSYANPGYVIITYLIEKYSGMSFHDYAKQTVLSPLGMTEANFLSFPPNFTNYAQGYAYKEDKFEEVPFYAVNAGLAGALNVDGSDMARFIQMWLNNGKVGDKEVFPAQLLQRMERTTTTLAAEKGLDNAYGLGLYHMFYGKDFHYLGHNGGIDGFSSTFAFNRELGLGFALSINNPEADNGPIEDLILRFLAQGHTAPTPAYQALDANAMAPYLGYYEYRSPRNQILYFMESIANGMKTSIKGDTLYLNIFGGGTETFVHTGNLKFRKIENNSPTLIAAMDENGKPVISARGYYEKTSALAYWAKRVSILAALLFGLLALPFSLFWFLLRLARKKPKTAWPVLLLQALSALSFIVSAALLSVAFNDLFNVGLVNGKTLSVFICTSVFGLAAWIGLPLLWRYWSKLNSRALRIYLLINALSLAYLATFFAMHGWIGMRLWAF